MYKAYYQSPIGVFRITSDEDGILDISFEEEFQKEVCSELPAVLEAALKQLDEYFQGKRKTFDLKLKLNGTEFQQRVWKQLMEVPYGETANYGQIAKAVGNEKASRAVGGANNKNRIPIVIPCHRIIGSNGSMVGYAGGLWRKEWLLQHERNNK